MSFRNFFKTDFLSLRFSDIIIRIECLITILIEKVRCLSDEISIVIEKKTYLLYTMVIKISILLNVGGHVLNGGRIGRVGVAHPVTAHVLT